MEKDRIKQLFKHHATAYYDCGCDAEFCDCEPDRRMYLGNFVHAINRAEKENKLEWYKKLLAKLEFIYASDLKVFGSIIDKNANNYYNEIRKKIKELENGN